MTEEIKDTEHEKHYTGSDLLKETMKILEEDDVAKKLPKEQLLQLSKLLVKTALKGDL